MSEPPLPIATGLCPVCGANDAFIEPLRGGQEYYVECVNCRVYRASRRAFRHFQYLREKADSESLARLGRLSSALRQRGRGAAIELEYDTWQELGERGVET